MPTARTSIGATALTLTLACGTLAVPATAATPTAQTTATCPIGANDIYGALLAQARARARSAASRAAAVPRSRTTHKVNAYVKDAAFQAARADGTISVQVADDAAFLAAHAAFMAVLFGFDSIFANPVYPTAFKAELSARRANEKPDDVVLANAAASAENEAVVVSNRALGAPPVTVIPPVVP
ncbi:hypothetical protein ABH940_002675 [Streptacidiphilus sp. BW17]|uniref:hypothetical protein n=1 Tax=Streptacidiphilus sp. BW17 TaxID=3156274 RepID=UPI0035159F50